ncbi:MAG: membrane protein insertase YidC [Bifidobacteriaceae bacterium]|jgi:YidC/Oxa1 family membrane protein insertase|nr:membrane protein insertase YidC [Bifidobacteriaceae bacterium]
MEVFNTLFGVPLGFLLYWCHQLIPSYGPAILVFTLATKVILFPLSLLAQKNAVAMVRIKPALDDIKRRFEGNQDLVLAEQRRLHKREHYSSLKGMAPMLIQIPIILGLINVIYKPLQHLLHLPSEAIRSLVARAAQLDGVDSVALGYGAQLRVIEQVQANPEAFADLANVGAGIGRIAALNMSFFGMDLAAVPTWTSWTIVWPALSALSALALCLYQNRHYILNRFQSPAANWAMTVFMVLFSGYFALVLPCGLGLYWTAGNLASIAVVWLCNVAYRPERHADLTAIAPRERLSRAQRADLRTRRRQASRRERSDAKRFFAAKGKQLVFYSEGSGYWKYFGRLIGYLLEHTDLTVHYVTSDPADAVFERRHPRLATYYIGRRALIAFMMKLDADVVVLTLPDLETFHIKRSLVRRDAEYIYLDHGMTSLHLMLREDALDHFDTVFCYGPNHNVEVRQLEELGDLPAKQLVNTGYGLLDDLLEAVAAQDSTPAPGRPVALVAPSWQVDNLMELCLEETVRPLAEAGFEVVVRPHPEFVKRFAPKVAASRAALADLIETGRVEFQTDFSSNATVYTADLVVTDWSSIAQEFSYATGRPSIFVNTPMKVMNPHWDRIAAPPLDITLRDQIGVSIDVADLGRIGAVAREFKERAAVWRERIEQVRRDNIYNIGASERAMGEYLVWATGRFERRRAAAERRPAARAAARSGAPAGRSDDQSNKEAPDAAAKSR